VLTPSDDFAPAPKSSQLFGFLVRPYTKRLDVRGTRHQSDWKCRRHPPSNVSVTNVSAGLEGRSLEIWEKRKGKKGKIFEHVVVSLFREAVEYKFPSARFLAKKSVS
jgi:hypothetical protein